MNRTLVQDLKAAFKSTDDYDLNDKHAEELVKQLESLGVGNVKVPVNLRGVRPWFNSIEYSGDVWLQDIRRMKLEDIQELKIPNMQKSILETVRQAQLPTCPPLRQVLAHSLYHPHCFSCSRASC